ncbi:MAG: FadD3 family acyl-CoA ligase [Actinomycetota bacterium]|nr:FadD3 family acyl-CoA ligase [Actinomycetota bacterium]
MSGEPRTTPAAVISAAARFPDLEAIVDGQTRLTFAQLHDQVRLLARFYLAEGVRPGDRVAIWSPNTGHWVLAALGAHYAGATLVPINTRYTAHEAGDILLRARVKILVVAGWFLGVDRLARLREVCREDPLPDLTAVLRVPLTAESGTTAPETDVARAETDAANPVIEWDQIETIAARVPVEQADLRAAAVSPDDISDILFTSGTTGRSKGVMSAHRQALAVASSWAACGQVSSADRYLVINPFFHSFGYKAGILVCVLTGATIVPQTIFDIDEAMRLVTRERVTVLPGPPTIYQAMLDHSNRGAFDLTSLRFAVTGAATVPVALVERMQTELNFSIVLTAYGLTEAVVVTMCRAEDPPATVAHTSGRATAGFEVRIDDSGEILLRGPNVMCGYLDDPEATAQAIDAEGWLHTGDIGTLDAAGYLTITDRLKDMYISGGFNVYPAEIEQALARLDGIAESAVIGVPDDRLGEVGKAFVITKPQAALTAADVLEFCRDRLANYKVPRHVEFRTDLPRNATGKPLKRLLREEHR